jgi:epoxyqueuosine reductase QueG
MSVVDAAWIQNIIETFINESAQNNLGDGTGEKAFGIPLIGYSRGDDPLYEAYKEHVGPCFITPWELFALTFGNSNLRAGGLTVITYILPQTEATKRDNRKESFNPSERWARARIFGEAVNVRLREHLVRSLTQAGHRAVAPLLAPQFSTRISPKYGLSSTWSERHAAYAAGLGTFGLCDGLITPAGKAVRVGSVVTRAPLAVTPRPYAGIHDYCLFYTHGTCGKCVPRCPVRALSEQGHDKDKCHRHVAVVCREYSIKNYGIETDCCGLCQTAVPCSDHIPAPEEGL